MEDSLLYLQDTLKMLQDMAYETLLSTSCAALEPLQKQIADLNEENAKLAGRCLQLQREVTALRVSALKAAAPDPPVALAPLQTPHHHIYA